MTLEMTLIKPCHDINHMRCGAQRPSCNDFQLNFTDQLIIIHTDHVITTQ
jgi:hypothetical protein